MIAPRLAAVVIAAGVVVSALMPVSAALASGEVLGARVAAVGLTAAACMALAFLRGGRGGAWTAVSAALGLAGVALLVPHVAARGTCLAVYDERPVLIGRTLTPAGAEYVRQHPGLGAADLLLDAGGAADRLWTAESIAACRFWTGWAGLLAVPCFAAAVCAAAASRGVTLGRARRTPAPAPPGVSIVYDAFLSYRHVEPDRAYAEEIVRAIEARGLRAAIDVRDFAPNRHFLTEMERCVKESRFTLCVVTPRYVDSDHTGEEAVIAKTLDLADRTRRLVPLVYERVPLPLWLHGLSGIDFTADARVDPLDRLLALLTAADAVDRPRDSRPPTLADHRPR